MDTSELDYDLPATAIAQHPVEPRDAARLLVDRGPGRPARHRTVADLPDLLRAGDLLVVNDTKVIPARLHLRKPTGGAVEVLLLERRPEGWWEGLVRPGRRVAPGTMLTPEDPAGGAAGDGPAPDLVVEVGEVIGDDGRRRIVVHGGVDDLAALDRHGVVPLPPYIHEPLADPGRYQTVFADRPGSVAAPTAGLHLTTDVLHRLRDRGVTIATVDLVVGLGTFRPVTVERVEDHPMHAERYVVPEATRAAVAEAVEDPARRVVAVGTTVVRALESWAVTGDPDASTRLFIHGDHRFRVVDVLMTNFHVPRSSLLALVESFVGPRWRDLYDEALAEGYRFLSFGDAMLLTGGPSAGIAPAPTGEEER
ncbi:MAG: tRNA preQ1(34) S-adenosylmethionine ribosyltransferase-isomerase QueA [Actinobacteria bacterium]|nr:tRNA preQ1(34) S-adenosylmethionine ribosyltransferase-isomerase QueA [Actinomycetota bacterium]